MSNNTNSVSILSLLRPLVKQILEDMMEEERRGYLRELRENKDKGKGWGKSKRGER